MICHLCYPGGLWCIVPSAPSSEPRNPMCCFPASVRTRLWSCQLHFRLPYPSRSVIVRLPATFALLSLVIWQASVLYSESPPLPHPQTCSGVPCSHDLDCVSPSSWHGPLLCPMYQQPSPPPCKSPFSWEQPWTTPRSPLAGQWMALLRPRIAVWRLITPRLVTRLAQH